MSNRYSHDDWRRLGRAVLAARTRRGWGDTPEWASVVDRSQRVVLGLERGERTGPKTLQNVEEALDWPVGYTDKILSDPNANLAPEVPRVMQERPGHVPSPRPLDQFTTTELLGELEDRFAEMALELHQYGRSAVSVRSERDDEVIEPLSPQRRREELRRQDDDDEPTDLATKRREPPAGTAERDQA